MAAEKIPRLTRKLCHVYEKAKEVLQSFAVTPEYALQRFLEECVKRKNFLLKRFKGGESAEGMITKTADE